MFFVKRMKKSVKSLQGAEREEIESCFCHLSLFIPWLLCIEKQLIKHDICLISCTRGQGRGDIEGLFTVKREPGLSRKGGWLDW